MTRAESIVNKLLEQQINVVVEYHPVQINDMEHITWMIRAATAEPTQYLAKGTAHNMKLAQHDVDEKIRLIGADVVDVVNTVG